MPILISVTVAILALNVLFVAIRLHASRPRTAADDRAPLFRSVFLVPTYATLVAKEYPRVERATPRGSAAHPTDH